MKLVATCLQAADGPGANMSRVGIRNTGRLALF
jgi:hypothetical protein